MSEDNEEFIETADMVERGLRKMMPPKVDVEQKLNDMLNE